MSNTPKCLSFVPLISLAKIISPAQVPKIGFPCLWKSKSAGSKPYFFINFPIVVLSPPGIIIPSNSSN